MTDKPIRLLIADDSTIFVDIFRDLLETAPNIILAGVATNGIEAIEMTLDMKPDIVTMDIHMPDMNGLGAIEQIMAHRPTPILVLSGDSSARVSFDALDRGALDVMVKPDFFSDGDASQTILEKLRFLSGIQTVRHIAGARSGQACLPRQRVSNDPFHVVAIAGSTGGPKALGALIAGLPSTFPACLLIVQHLSPGFCHALADWLNSIGAIDVRVAKDNDELRPGRAYIAPDGRHLTIGKNGRIVLKTAPAVDGHLPSASVLFRSIARRYSKKAIGIVLTGMGTDGGAGMVDIRAMGGTTIAQDEASSLIYGMPKHAVGLNAVDHVLSVGDISEKLISITSGSA